MSASYFLFIKGKTMISILMNKKREGYYSLSPHLTKPYFTIPHHTQPNPYLTKILYKKGAF
jgi:hypothetical protein